MRAVAVFGACLGAISLHAAAADAQSSASSDPSKVKRPLWELGIGVAGLRLPDYRGSDENRAYLLPLPYVVYRGQWLRADREGARAMLLDGERVEIDVSVSGTVPSKSRDNVARQGMPDLPPTFEIGPNMNLGLYRSSDRRVKLDLRLPLRAAITVQRSPHAVGATFTPNLNLDLLRVHGGWNIGLLSGPLYGNRRHHQHIYGVDAAFATPQRPAYRAPGGYAGWQALASMSRRFDNTWVGAFVRYDHLRGAAYSESPLLRREHAVMLGVGISWVFASSTELVAIDD